MKKTIILKNTTIGYHSSGQNRIVAQNINASLQSGELTCLIGANGTGKSTLLRTLSAFQPPLEGDILLSETSESDHLLSVSMFSQKQLAKSISVVLTTQMDDIHLKVEEIIGLGRSPYSNFWGSLSQEDQKIVNEAIHEVGIQHLRGRIFNTLSDGERQKVMIAKALAQQTPIILLDEPTAFLDFPSKVETLLMLKRLAHQLQKSILISTHDVEIALQLADKIWLMEKLSANQEKTENHNEEDHHDKIEAGNSVLSVGTPQELADKGALSHFLDTPEITFDKRTMRIHFSMKS